MASLSPLNDAEILELEQITPQRELELLSSPSSTTNATPLPTSLPPSSKTNHKRNLKKLRKHRNLSTLPTSLKINLKPTCPLSNDLQKKWDQCLVSCSTKLCNILITHHEEEILKSKNHSTNLPELMSITPDFPKGQRDRDESKRGESIHTTQNDSSESTFFCQKIPGATLPEKEQKNKEKKILRNILLNTYNQKLIVNLTSFQLPIPLSSILSKGLQFVPTPMPTRWQTIFNSFLRFSTDYIY